uniref:NADH-ubiquinone oxidoreductase chain 3 n=1 Tax=Plectosphaerella sp. TaxID=1929893 RepID=A0A4D6SSM4_9PEZI|nr:NADH dehydrogenase subunit 3 [Plectosphaerella sp.]
MSSLTIFITLVLLIAMLFLVLNFAFAPHNPYKEKYSIFECGFHSFLRPNSTQFGIKFFIFGLVYLLLALEIISIYPYAVSEYDNGLYGFAIVLIFPIVITIGFVFELPQNDLKIASRQTLTNIKKSHTSLATFSEN